MRRKINNDHATTRETVTRSSNTVPESFRTRNSVVDNPTQWFQVACRGCGARTSPLPGVTRTFRVHPLLPSTFLPVLHIPSPVPFRHNNRAVSQRVFNGRRLHATRPRPASSSSPSLLESSSLFFDASCHFLFLASPFCFLLFFLLCAGPSLCCFSLSSFSQDFELAVGSSILMKLAAVSSAECSFTTSSGIKIFKNLRTR